MAVSYNKMSSIQIGGTYVNYVSIGTRGNVSLDCSGNALFRGNVFVDGSFNILNINSSNTTSDFNFATNQTTGNINIGTGLTTGFINLGNIVASGATFNTALPTSTLTPSSSTQLTTKTYVDSAVSSIGGVSLSGSNIFTGTNAFNTNLPTSTLTPSSSTDLTTKNYVDSSFCSLAGTQTITGDKTFNGSIDFLSFSVSSIDNTGSISTPSVVSALQTDDLLVGQNQTSGKLFLGCRTDRTGNINIGTLATGNAPINIGSTSSTTQTATHNAITTFSKIPSCSVAPTTSNHLTNKTYVDSNFCSLTGTQTVSGEKTFSNGNTFVSGNLVSNNIKSTSGTLNISTNPASVVDNLNISTGADMFLDCGALGKIYLSQASGTCFSIDGASANFNTEANFFADVNFSSDTVSDGFFVHNMMPTATIIQNVSSTVPNGFLYCDGQAVSRSTYSNLFTKISTTFGVGNGTTTFNVPNFKGAFLRGASSQVVGGVTYAGAAIATAQQDSVLEAYNEGYWTVDSGGGGSSRTVRSRVQITGDPEDTGTNSTTKFTRQNATENRVFNYSVYYYIRY